MRILTTTKLTALVSFLVLLAACNSSEPETVTKVVTKTDTIYIRDTVFVAKTTDAAPANTPTTDNSTKPLEEKPTPTLESRPSVVKETGTVAKANCFTDEKQLSLDLTLFAEQLENMNLEYDNKNPERLQDCSGIFHRFVQYMEGKCPQFEYPKAKRTRDARSLAKWYHKKDNLHIVQDPMQSRNFIKPGSVMFYGVSGKRYSDLTIDMLCCQKPRGIVFHIGTVTEVFKDDAGDVTGYVLMHGRRPGKSAQRSHYHKVAPPRAGFPILGNWNQQWVAVANIMTPK